MEAGTRLGAYEIVGRLGAGGMGEVYRARDTSLRREVAIKVLPRELGAEPDRLARLEREARLLAALNHPNIATIHSVEESDGTRFLVMELVEGETLQELLVRGPLSVDKALDLCRQIAEALEAAHGNGILHRDLKPANIMVGPRGRAKVLDFGLAKSLAAEARSTEVSDSPTLTVAGTATGVILGTAPYMSPEQARGQEVDERTDIWAFGCVLYEALTGARAFARETVADTIAAVLQAEPSWRALPADTPSPVARLAVRCLRKDPDRRLHDIADGRIELEDALSAESPPRVGSSGSWPATGRRALPWLVAAAAVLVAGFALRPTAETPAVTAGDVVRLSIPLPPGLSWAASSVSISPSGDRIALVGRDDEGRRVWTRRLDGLEFQPVHGTEGAEDVGSFSPDGRSVLYFKDGSLWRVEAEGGPSIRVAEAFPRGTAWGADGGIVFQHEESALFRVSASGGEPEQITVAGTGSGGHRWPQALPGGGVLFTERVTDRVADEWRIAVATAGGSPPVILRNAGTSGRYVPTGHLVFARSGSLLAVPLDLDTLTTTGLELSVIDDLEMASRVAGSAAFDFAQNGTLVYVPSVSERLVRPLLVGMDGSPEDGLDVEPGAYGVSRYSRGDGGALAIDRRFESRNRAVTLYRPGRPPRTLAVEGARQPRWHPDGRRLVVSRDLSGTVSEFLLVDPGGDEPPRSLFETTVGIGNPLDISPDGSALIYQKWIPGVGYDVHEFDFDSGSDREMIPGPGDRDAVVSPDGGMIAYTSIDEGQAAIFVRSYRPGEPVGRAVKVSSGPGTRPRWSPGRRRLFYLASGEARGIFRDWAETVVMMVDIGADPPTTLSEPEPLFSARVSDYDVRPDGSGFILLDDVSSEWPDPVVVLNWFEELTRLVPTGR